MLLIIEHCLERREQLVAKEPYDLHGLVHTDAVRHAHEDRVVHPKERHQDQRASGPPSANRDILYMHICNLTNKRLVFVDINTIQIENIYFLSFYTKLTYIFEFPPIR